MTEKEVIDAIKYMQEYQTETDKIEAKTAEKGCPQKCYDTISAFANKYGGIIIFGINEHNNFIEQDVYDVNDLQKQITSLCTTSLEPKIRPEFLAVTYNNKKLLAVKINELPQKKKPCYYKLEQFEEKFEVLVRQMFSYMDVGENTAENFYHAFVLGKM